MSLPENFRPKIRKITNNHIDLYRQDPEKAHKWPVTKTEWVTALLLRTRGRKTGEDRYATLQYFRDGDRILIVASYGGAPENPVWYLNLVETPECEIQLGRFSSWARARTAKGEERARLWDKVSREQPTYLEYQARSERQIPIVVLEPFIPDTRPPRKPLVSGYVPGHRKLTDTFKAETRTVTNSHIQAYLADPEKAHMWDVGAPDLMPTLLLTTRGRKTGEARRATLSYYRVGDKIIIVGSYGGSPEHPLWYGNLLETPECEIQVGKFHAYARARTVQGEERADLWEKVCGEPYSNYKAYQARTERQLPLIVLDPYIPDIPIS